jgi:hypothetical protein
MRLLAWSLVGLKHPVGEAVLFGDVKVRVEDAGARQRCVLDGSVVHLGVGAVLENVAGASSAAKSIDRVLLDVTRPVDFAAVVGAAPRRIVRVVGVEGRRDLPAEALSE